MPYRNVVIAPLGGLNEDENPHALSENELVRALNVQYRGHTLGTRPGLVRPGSSEDFASKITGGNPIQRLFEYRQNFDAGRRLLAVVEEDGAGIDNIAYEDGLRLDLGAIVVTEGQDNYWSFTIHQNNLIGAGSESDHTLIFWDGTVANAVTALDIDDSGSNQIQAKFVKSWRNYVLINGLVGRIADDNNPACTRFADFGSDPATAANWAAGNTIGFSSKQVAGVSSFGKNFSTGFGTYQDNNGDYLYILGNDAIFSVIQDPQSDFIVSDAVANGCVHERAFISLGVDSGDAVYVSSRGIHSLRASQQFGARADAFLSWKIRPTWNTLNRNRMENIFGAYDHVRGNVVLAVATGSSTAADTLLVLDVKESQQITAQNARWTIWKIAGDDGTNTTPPTPFLLNDLAMARDANDNWHLYAGTVTGDVLRFSDDTFSDVGEAYPVEFQTKHNDYGVLSRSKQLGDIMVTLQPGGSYEPKMSFIFDYGARQSSERALKMVAPLGFILGTSLLGGPDLLRGSATTRDEKVYGTGKGRTIGFKFSHSGGNEPFWVSKIDHQVNVLGEDVGDTANA